MKNMKFWRTALVTALVLTVMLSVTGGTIAWFTDTVTSESNIIKAGNLDVTMHWADGTQAVPTDDNNWTDASAGAIFDYDLWEPGYVQVRHVKIANTGSLALKYKVEIEATGTVSDLANVIDVYYVDPAVRVSDRTALTADKRLGTLTEMLDGMAESASGSLLAGASDTITLALKMQESAGNDYQGKSIGSDFAVKLVATQLTSEEDSFGKDYDELAEYPAVGTVNVTNTSEEQSISAGNVKVTIPANVKTGKYELVVNKIAENTDAENNTTLSLDIELRRDNEKVEETTSVKYKVAITVGKGLSINEVTHKGVPVEYDYDSVGGVVNFVTESFGPFTVSYAGTINKIVEVNNAEELISVLDGIKTKAQNQIRGETGNKAYRENVTIVLKNDIVIDSLTNFMYTGSNGAPLHFYGVRGVLDLNGHDITVASDALLSGKAHANAVLLFQYSNVSIIGEGDIIAENKSIPVYAWANCTVDIYGGNYVTNAYERNESAVYVNNESAKVNVYGGTYTDSAYAFNVYDECGKTPTIVLHEGITYADFLKDGTTDVTASDINNGRIVIAEGCELQKDENDNAYTVVKR